MTVQQCSMTAGGYSLDADKLFSFYSDGLPVTSAAHAADGWDDGIFIKDMWTRALTFAGR